MDDSKILKWIMETNLRRWLLFLPLSIVSALLGNILWEFINQISMGRMISTDSFLYNLYNMPVSGIITGFIFVYVGGYIAPHRNTIIFLVSIVIITSLASILGDIFVFKSPDYWMCLFCIFHIIGAFIGRSYLNNGKK
jgi:hypothetical protein